MITRQLKIEKIRNSVYIILCLISTYVSINLYLENINLTMKIEKLEEKISTQSID